MEPLLATRYVFTITAHVAGIVSAGDIGTGDIGRLAKTRAAAADLCFGTVFLLEFANLRGDRLPLLGFVAKQCLDLTLFLHKIVAFAAQPQFLQPA